MNSKFAKLVFLSAALAANAACSSAQGDEVVKANDAKQKLTHTHNVSPDAGTYKKPSAAIYFDVESSGVIPIGTSDIITLKVRDEYPGATISYKILNSEGLNYFGPSEMTMPSTAMSRVSATAPEEGQLNANIMSLQVQPFSEGVHKLTVVATARLADGQSIVRSQTIPIYTSEQFKPTKEDTLNSQKLKNAPVVSNGVVIMDAEETIED